MKKREPQIDPAKRKRIINEWDKFPIGFDYKKALRKLIHAGYTQEEIAHRIGYGGNSQVSKMLKGAEPKHRAGEAIYILYVESFGERPV